MNSMSKTSEPSAIAHLMCLASSRALFGDQRFVCIRAPRHDGDHGNGTGTWPDGEVTP